MKKIIDFSELDALKDHPASERIDEQFRNIIKEEKMSKPKDTVAAKSSDSVIDDQELSLEEDEGFELSLSEDEVPPEAPHDEGLDLSLSEDDGLELSEEPGPPANTPSGFGEISLNTTIDGLSALQELNAAEEISQDDSLSLDDLDTEDPLDLSGTGVDHQPLSDNAGDSGLSLDEISSPDFSLKGGEISSDVDVFQEELVDEIEINFGSEEGSSRSDVTELSADAMQKLREIDAIMHLDASQVIEKPNLSETVNDPNESLVSPDLDLESIDFSNTDEQVASPVRAETSIKKKEASNSKLPQKSLGADLRELSGAYSGEMERLQATISNLRSDREELLNKLQVLEDEKVFQSRQHLSLRAELDEKKIELTIIRRKLNEEINELRDQLKLFDEKKLILEEKNRLLAQELDKTAQKNKIDVKKVQMRERELEQKLELLKADAENQVRNRDLKILELKRKIDSMEFDMESISQQERRSVESRFELEDKLGKAIKTLRTAITVLENDSDKAGALSALKKNIEV